MNQKLQIKNKRPGVVFSKKEKQKENKDVISNLDKRINDLLHKIEFTDASPNEAYKLYMKLQGFLRKKRAIKPIKGHIYVPRTETGNYIINGKVTKLKKGEYDVTKLKKGEYDNGERQRNNR